MWLADNILSKAAPLAIVICIAFCLCSHFAVLQLMFPVRKRFRTAHLTPKHKCSIHRRPSVSPTVVHPSHNKSVTVLPITRRDADGDAMIMMQVRPGPQPVKLTARNIISIYQQDHRHRHQFSAHSYFCPRYFCPRTFCVSVSRWLLQLTVAASHELF